MDRSWRFSALHKASGGAFELSSQMRFQIGIWRVFNYGDGDEEEANLQLWRSSQQIKLKIVFGAIAGESDACNYGTSKLWVNG